MYTGFGCERIWESRSPGPLLGQMTQQLERLHDLSAGSKQNVQQQRPQLQLNQQKQQRKVYHGTTTALATAEVETTGCQQVISPTGAARGAIALTMIDSAVGTVHHSTETKPGTIGGAVHCRTEKQPGTIGTTSSLWPLSTVPPLRGKNSSGRFGSSSSPNLGPSHQRPVQRPAVRFCLLGDRSRRAHDSAWEEPAVDRLFVRGGRCLGWSRRQWFGW